MANPLPNEEKLYERIRAENINIDSVVWDIIYNRLGDDISGINLLCQFYSISNQPIPIQEAKKILLYTRHIKEIVKILTCASQGGLGFPELHENPLHPLICEMFTHYIGNDVYVINLIVQDSIDPLDPRPVPCDSISRILERTRSIKLFLNRLRENTYNPPQQKALLGQPGEKEKRAIGRDEIFIRLKRVFADEFSLNPEKVVRNARFREDLGLDSVDSIQVIMILESEFGFEIPDDDAERVFTVGQACEYIHSRVKSVG